MKRYMMLITMLFFALVLAACGAGNAIDEEVPGNINDDNPANDHDFENDDEQQGTKNDQEISDEEDLNDHLITDTGIYNGQADPHTIEIETEHGPLAFQLTMEAREDVESLTVDEEVTYSYIEDGDLREIQSINPH